MKEINEELLDKFRSEYREDSYAHVLNAAMSKTPISDLAFVPMNAAKLNGDFSIEIKTNGITAQEKSGRCWMFAALNILREIVAKNCSMKEFELSQNYITFYDKLEKANNFLEMAIEYSDEPWDSQMMRYILAGIDDGGYWGEAADLIKKYGAVPKSVNPESYQSNHTAKFMELLNTLLRKDACELQEIVRGGGDPQPRKEEMLAEVYRAECIAFGEPVKVFDFEYRDKDNKYHCDRAITPKEFYDKYIGVDLDDYISVSCEPYPDRKINTPVEFHSTCNMAGRSIRSLNISQQDLEDLCIKQLKGGDPFWFACDADAYGARKEGVWDPDSLGFEGILGGVDLSMPRDKRLEYRNSAPNHAMMMAGVNIADNGQPDRWKIENSWGKDNGRDGYFVCSEKYFKEYVYEAIIDKKYLSDDQVRMLEKDPVRVDPWEEDGMIRF